MKSKKLKLTLDVLIPSEEVIVTVTKDGYIKRTSRRSYSASNGTGLCDERIRLSIYYEVDDEYAASLTIVHISLGNYIYQPVHELPDIRWKDLGQHISSIVPLDSNETIIKAIPIEKFDGNLYILAVSKLGQIKRSSLAEYQVQRYSRALNTMNLKKGDRSCLYDLVTPTDDVFIVTL